MTGILVVHDPAMLFSETTPQRVVSLVPSMTESLFDLGCGQWLVGVSDYCNRPAATAGVTRVGGPKNARIEDILALRPDLVIANREENTQAVVEGLAAAGVRVWLTFPLTVQAALDDLWALTRLFRSDLARQKVSSLERSLEWVMLANAERPRRRVFCPIWQERLEDGDLWWMTFNAHTYPSDLLATLGAENVFAQRERRYPLLADVGQVAAEAPGERDTRYPRVTRAEVLSAQPDLIVLPDEPFAYSQKDVDAMREWFAGTPAAENGNIVAVYGSLLMWPGTRLALALGELDGLFSS